jgi:hypothetical protein
MTRFLGTADGGLVNIDQIARIEGSRAILVDGAAVKLVGDIDREEFLAPVVAAAPGYFRLRAWPEQGLPLLTERLPVVAWRCATSMTWPVVPADSGDGGELAVLLPDGRVVAPYGDAFVSEEAWRSAMERLISAREKEATS